MKILKKKKLFFDYISIINVHHYVSDRFEQNHTLHVSNIQKKPS